MLNFSPTPCCPSEFLLKLIIPPFCCWSALKSWSCLPSSPFLTCNPWLRPVERIFRMRFSVLLLFQPPCRTLSPVFPSFCTLRATFIFPECGSHALKATASRWGWPWASSPQPTWSSNHLPAPPHPSSNWRFRRFTLLLCLPHLALLAWYPHFLVSHTRSSGKRCWFLPVRWACFILWASKTQWIPAWLWPFAFAA